MNNSERIREYISNNPGTTEYKVAKYMAENHYCARDTTHSLIYNTLISGGKVIDKKIGNSFHKLYINNEDEFNIISRLLSEIDNLIQAMDEPTHKYYFKIAHATAAELSYLQPVKDYLFGYQGQVDRILKVLLLRISELSLPEKESQVLYGRLVKLLIKVSLQFKYPDHRRFTEMLRYFSYEKKPVPALKKMGIDTKLRDSLLTVVNNFKDYHSNAA